MSDTTQRIVAVALFLFVFIPLAIRRFVRWQRANDYPVLEEENEYLKQRLHEYAAEQNAKLVSQRYSPASPDNLERKLRDAEERAAAAEKRAQIAEERLAKYMHMNNR